MNNVNLTGRIGKDPEVFTFDSGEKQTSFSLAVDNGYYSKDKNEWIDRTVWLNIVKRGETKLKKGDLIEVSGKLNVRDYENKDGNKVYITEVVAFTTGLLNRKDSQENPAEFEKRTTEKSTGVEEISDSDTLPF